MTTGAQLIIDAEAMRRLDYGAVHGPIVLRLGDFEFPAAGWTDFVVAVLSAWCEAASDVLSAEAAAVHFQEGPYSVEISSGSEVEWILVLIERTRVGGERCSQRVEAESFVRSILLAADGAVAACRRRGWCPHDTERLASAAQRLRTLFGQRSRLH